MSAQDVYKKLQKSIGLDLHPTIHSHFSTQSLFFKQNLTKSLFI